MTYFYEQLFESVESIGGCELYRKKAYPILLFWQYKLLEILIIFGLFFVFITHKTLRKVIYFCTFRRVSRYVECLENCIFFAKHLLISEKKCTFAAKTRPEKC